MPELTAGFDPTKYGMSPTFNPTAEGLPSTFSYGAKDFQVDPGYQFALEQGQQAIQRSAAAKGGLVSGGALKDLSAYTTGMASQQYGTAYARAQGTYQQNYQNALNKYQQNYSNLFNTFETNQQNKYGRLNALAGMGLTATGMASQAGQNFAANAGQYTIAGGNALAAGTVGGTNALTSGIAGASNAVTGGIAAYQNQQYQQQLLDLMKGYQSSVSVGGVPNNVMGP